MDLKNKVHFTHNDDVVIKITYLSVFSQCYTVLCMQIKVVY